MTHDELEKLCTYLEKNDASMEAQREAASEMRRLHAINAELLDALSELIAEADAPQGWDGHPHPNTYGFQLARAAIANATKGTT